MAGTSQAMTTTASIPFGFVGLLRDFGMDRRLQIALYRHGRPGRGRQHPPVLFYVQDSTMATAEPNHIKRSIGFINWAHALDHYVMLIFPTVVIGLEIVYGRSYAELIALGTPAFIAFGVFSLPAGWLADRWSRRNMMVMFYAGCGLSLLAAGLAPNLIVLAAALTALGMFAAIYHPVGTAMLIEHAIDLARHDEIVLVQSLDLLRAQRHGRVAPAEAGVGMMSFRLGKLADPLHEGERFAKIAESKRALDAVGIIV